MLSSFMAILDDPEGFETATLARMVPDFFGLRVLEVGCADGRLTRKYVQRAASVVAIDPDVDAIARLADELPGVDARATGIHDLVLPAGSIDVAIFAWSL
jgi:2-polyprenyl-3-methyl-5-hydroxy-6-metoxy-1,4-benzoquinol methylase